MTGNRRKTTQQAAEKVQFCFFLAAISSLIPVELQIVAHEESQLRTNK